MQSMMNASDIAFPNLGIYLENVPKTISAFGKELMVFGQPIALYGLILGLGILAGLLMAEREAKRTGQNPDIYWDLSLYAIVFSIIGARLYYVAFSWNYYKDNLWEIFNIREGGIAIYGAVIAATITIAIFAKIKKLSFLQLTDTTVLGLLVGQIIGRYGNFMNREAFGGYSDGLFAMALPVEAVRAGEITAEMTSHIEAGMNYIQVHPTFLYESLWNVGVLLLLLLYRSHKKFQGEMTLLYLGGYGIGRGWIEGLRTDQLLIGNTDIAVSQVLAFILVIVSVVGLVYGHMKMKSNKNKV